MNAGIRKDSPRRTQLSKLLSNRTRGDPRSNSRIGVRATTARRMISVQCARMPAQFLADRGVQRRPLWRQRFAGNLMTSETVSLLRITAAAMKQINR